ncbi:MAG TPA: lantibiotic dehydratase [Thermoanaerobaculia bacterium]|nr:lantibiotic dehydratase [Thermoanaerobaculia bacterium]
MNHDFEPSELVVLRTPLLPFEELEAWSAGLLSSCADGTGLEEALAHDRALLRGRLKALIERPELREALFLASPDLAEGLEHWQRDPESRKGRRAEQSLVRYFLRMASRPAPFGLLSGSTPGSVGERTRLALAERRAYRRHSRLDMHYLFLLCDRLGRDAGVRSEVLFRPNSSLYEAAGRLRYAEARPYLHVRRYHLVAVDSFDALESTLERAAEGALLGDLADALVDEEITLEDATSFLHELVDNQILIPDLMPPVTGEESTPALLGHLAGLGSAAETREHLARAHRELAGIDAGGLGSPLESYHRIARELEPLGIPVQMRRLFQVDLVKPAQEVALGRDVTGEILRGVDVLHRVSPPGGESGGLLEDFRKAFRERYGEGREMPLLEVLDEEIGIGFDRLTKASADASPLLANLRIRPRREGSTVSWTLRETTLLALLSEALEKGRTEVTLTEKDLGALAIAGRVPLPDAFHASVALAASSPEAAERGDFRILLDHLSGPSGARLIGRFCHADERIHEGVRAHLAAEEARDPDAVYAEIAHLPAGRIGNILSRPVLRGYEIPYLGGSGAPRERQIPVQDLTVTVEGDRVMLRSRRLGREVVPRLTSAHFTGYESLGVYRLAGALQEQGRASNLQWSWGPLDTAPFLPRITLGRLVLSRARWRALPNEIAPLTAAKGAARYRLARQWQQERRMPRFVFQLEADIALLVDFDNPLSLDAMIEGVKGRFEVLLAEAFPSPGELGAVQGPEGRFFHDLLVLFTRKGPQGPQGHQGREGRIARSFPPGSEWLYARIFTGSGTADQVLLGEIAPLAREALAAGDIRSWHFLRSADPEWHLGVRFHGDPERLNGAVLPRLQGIFHDLLESGRAWRCQLDTYERSPLSEEVFFHDSEAAVDILDSLQGDADLRWKLMMMGLDRLLEDFGHDLEGRLRIVEREWADLAGRYQYQLLRGPLAERLRGDRPELERLLFLRKDGPEELRPGLEALARRSQALRQLQVKEIVPEYLHAFANRLSRSAGAEHEMVIYDYLSRIYRSLLARQPSIRKST